eukprot:6195210-Pleurochrysis_carterae.AAC.1
MAVTRAVMDLGHFKIALASAACNQWHFCDLFYLFERAEWLYNAYEVYFMLCRAEHRLVVCQRRTTHKVLRSVGSQVRNALLAGTSETTLARFPFRLCEATLNAQRSARKSQR